VPPTALFEGELTGAFAGAPATRCRSNFWNSVVTVLHEATSLLSPSSGNAVSRKNVAKRSVASCCSLSSLAVALINSRIVWPALTTRSVATPQRCALPNRKPAFVAMRAASVVAVVSSDVVPELATRIIAVVMPSSDIAPSGR